MSFHTYDDCLRYLSQCTNYERMTDFRYSRDAFDLAPVREVLRALGNPQEAAPIIHVAGTKGKGSVCAMVAWVLRAAGHRVGLFSKPHLLKLNERISVDGTDIGDQQFVEMMNVLHPHLERQRLAGGALTFFDLIVVMALTHFAREGTDAVVLEVGFGGRLDSTNVVTPAVSVITTIGFDHTQLLGDTLAKIAAEKAGIIKPGVPAVSGETEPEPAGVIAEAAERAGVPFRVRERDFGLGLSRGGFTIRTWRGEYDGLSVPLLGEHQRRNAAVAVAALEAFVEARGEQLVEADVRAGLANVRAPGRTELFPGEPTVVLDVAHNPSSLAALAEVLKIHFEGKRIVLLLGMAEDKDVRANLATILPSASAVVLTGTGHPRGAEPAELARLCVDRLPELPCEVEPDIDRAIRRALALAGDTGVMCATGSFYLVGEVLRQRQPTTHR